MAIVSRCACGNRISVADALAGKTIPCPKCGGDVALPSAPNSPAGTAKSRQAQAAVPAVSVSPGIIISAVVGITVLIIVLVLYFGPWTVGKEWEAMSKDANTQVTDTMQFALSAYLSQHGMYNAAKSHNVPMVQGDAVFIPPMMVMSLPKKMVFSGKTNQGNYKGTYDTTTGEIAAQIEYGGWTIGGLVDAKKAIGTFNMTGREKDGKVTAETDDGPLQIVIPKVKDADE
jgi:hypothetical protein